MKKYILLLLVSFSSVIIFSQKYSNTEKALISSKIDTLMMKYFQNCALSEHPGLKKQNDKMVKEFRSLFTNDASIFDDITVVYEPDAIKLNEYPYILESKSKNGYFDDLKKNFENGFVIINKRINIDYDNIDLGIVKVALERQIEGTSLKGYKLQNNDTLMLSISVLKDKSVQISRVEKIGCDLKILNDKNLDGVIDEKDKKTN